MNESAHLEHRDDYGLVIGNWQRIVEMDVDVAMVRYRNLPVDLTLKWENGRSIFLLSACWRQIWPGTKEPS